MSIKKKCLLASLALLLLLLCNPHPSRAQGPSGDTLTQMQNEGWKIIQDGVLQRELRAGEVESFVFGVPGFVWKLQDLQKQLGNLQKVYRAHPTPELRRAIVNHRKEIANTRKALAQARLGEASGESNIEKVSCNINFAYDASASYGTSAQGTWGKASANFSSNCAFSGEVYAYAYATATVNGGPVTMTVTDGPRSGASVSATVTATQNGASSCESYGYGSMTSYSLNPSSYSMTATNLDCPPVVTPLNASVTSNAPSTTIDLYNSDCTTITWTTSASGGTAPYTSTMSVNGVSQGTRTTYSGSYCNAGTNTSSTVAVSSTVTDSGSPAQSKSVSAPTITIRSHVVAPSVTINGPNYAGSGATTCMTYTWTSSVSGGTSPYTYQWTWNGTAVGTGSSYSRSVCPGSTYSYTTNTLALTVTDSASRTGSASKSVDVERSGGSGGGGGTCSTCQIP